MTSIFKRMEHFRESALEIRLYASYLGGGIAYLVDLTAKLIEFALQTRVHIHNLFESYTTALVEPEVHPVRDCGRDRYTGDQQPQLAAPPLNLHCPAKRLKSRQANFTGNVGSLVTVGDATW